MIKMKKHSDREDFFFPSQRTNTTRFRKHFFDIVLLTRLINYINTRQRIPYVLLFCIFIIVFRLFDAECRKDGHFWAAPGHGCTIATTTSARVTTSPWWTTWTASTTEEARQLQQRPPPSPLTAVPKAISARLPSTTTDLRRRRLGRCAADPILGCPWPMTISNKRYE